MSKFQDILFSALQETEYLRSATVNDDLNSRFLSDYDTYHLSVREADIYKIIGKQLDAGTCNILDVGSGEGKTAAVLLSEANTHVHYVSIDKKEAPKMVRNAHHNQIDVFDSDLLLDDDACKFDIVLIDVEPHGREIDVYEKVKHMMKPDHLCILKHISYIDLFGSYYADMFLERYKERVFDFFGEYNKSMYGNVRDVFIIMSSCSGERDWKCQSLATGEKARYADDTVAYILSYYN